MTDPDLILYALLHIPGTCPRCTRIRSKSMGCPDKCKVAK